MTEGDFGDFLFLYVTAPSFDIARTIARDLIENNLVACGNILPGATSLYHWEGKIEEAQEVILVLKTRDVLYDKVEERIHALHPHECPCIVGIPVSCGSRDFLAWIEAQTSQSLLS